jgi:hypothetical protein
MTLHLDPQSQRLKSVPLPLILQGRKELLAHPAFAAPQARPKSRAAPTEARLYHSGT